MTLNPRQNGVLALQLDALLCVATCSSHAARASDTMLKRHDALQHVGRSRRSSWPAALSDGARCTAYLFFAEGERTPLPHQSPLSPTRIGSSISDSTCVHIARCESCKRRLHKKLKPTFCILLAWDFRLARSRCTCGDRI